MVEQKKKDRPKRKPEPSTSYVLPEDMLDEFVGGTGKNPRDLLRATAKCPVPGCGFECATLGELNVHMRTKHPERCV